MTNVERIRDPTPAEEDDLGRRIGRNAFFETLRLRQALPQPQRFESDARAEKRTAKKMLLRHQPDDAEQDDVAAAESPALEKSKEDIEDLVAKIRSASDALAAAFVSVRAALERDWDSAAFVDLYDSHENLRVVCTVNPARYCQNRPELFKEVDDVFSRAMRLLEDRVAFPVSLRLTWNGETVEIEGSSTFMLHFPTGPDFQFGDVYRRWRRRVDWDGNGPIRIFPSGFKAVTDQLQISYRPVTDRIHACVFTRCTAAM